MLSDPLDIIAAISGVSYGRLAPERLRALLTSETPVDAGERARLRQAGAKADPDMLVPRASALGMTLQDLSARFERLTGERLEELKAFSARKVIPLGVHGTWTPTTLRRSRAAIWRS
jgi:hypothetical protein